MGRGFRSLRGDDATLVTRGPWRLDLEQLLSTRSASIPSRHFLNILVRPHVDAHIAGQHGAARTHTCTRTTRPTTRGDRMRDRRDAIFGPPHVRRGSHPLALSPALRASRPLSRIPGANTAYINAESPRPHTYHTRALAHRHRRSTRHLQPLATSTAGFSRAAH